MKYDATSAEVFGIDRDLATFHAMGDRNRARDILATHLARAVDEGRRLAHEEAIERARQERSFLAVADAHFVTADGLNAVASLPLPYFEIPEIKRAVSESPEGVRTGEFHPTPTRTYRLTGHHVDGRPIYTEQP